VSPTSLESTRLPAASRCQEKGCGRKKLASSELCAEHLNVRLARERGEREAAEEARRRLRAKESPLPPGAHGSPLAPGESRGEGGSGRAEPSISVLRESVLARIDERLGGIVWPLALGPFHPRRVARAMAEGIGRLPEREQREVWRALDAALARGALDRGAWSEMGEAIAAGLGRAGSAVNEVVRAMAGRSAATAGGAGEPRTGAGEGKGAGTGEGAGSGAETETETGTGRGGGAEEGLVRAGVALGVPEKFLRRRLAGEYETDPWGYDPELVEVLRPAFRWLYRRYFRVQTTGLENVPAQGRAVVVANHSGALPWDGAMLTTALLEEHPRPRPLRLLVLDWFSALPFAQPLLMKTGMLVACPENGEKLLSEDQLVGVFPEGVKGVGKPIRDRYRLARFGRGGFIRMALRTGAPIVPVAIVGAEEVYPTLFRLEGLGRLFGLPFIPITATFPWLGPLGLVPLPTRFRIRFGKPMDLKPYDEKAADDFLVVSHLANEVRNVIQGMVDEMLAERTSVFF